MGDTAAAHVQGVVAGNCHLLSAPSNIMRRRLMLVLLTMLIALISGTSPAFRADDRATSLAWRVALANTSVEYLIEIIGWDVTLDADAGKMYWTGFGQGKIQRANLHGSRLEDDFLLIPPFPEAVPVGMAQDANAGKVYWSNRTGGKIQRANSSGTTSSILNSVETLVEGAEGVNGLALDLIEGRMYWSVTEDNKIQRADLDGSEMEVLIGSGLSGPAFVDLDLNNGLIYWTEPSEGRIRRANLDGTGMEDVITGLTRPVGIALDLVWDRVYWSDFNDDVIRRATLNGGGGIEDVVAVNAQPSGIALDSSGGMIYVATLGRGSGG